MSYFHRHTGTWTVTQVGGLFISILSLCAIGLTKSVYNASQKSEDRNLFTVAIVAEGVVCFVGLLLIFIPLFQGGRR